MRQRLRTGLLFLIGLYACCARASEIKVAAAADLKAALDTVMEHYQAKFPKEKVTAVYGASGKFMSQIKQGAPFDVFLSADSERTDALARAGLTLGKPFPYAHGYIVLWVRHESKIKLDGKMDCLRNKSVNTIAMANARLAPYGQVAEAALKKARLIDDIRSKLVIGENISQAAQFVESSAADVGILAKSLALSPTLKKEGRYVDVDPSLYDPLVQTGVVLKGPQSKAAQLFVTYFLNKDSQEVLTSYGLTP